MTTISELTINYDEIGIFIKAGSIIPRKVNKRMSSIQALKDAFLLDIYPDLDYN
jgi:alpha-glucosidase (family GH31 glycosyl hydrolase)